MIRTGLEYLPPVTFAAVRTSLAGIALLTVAWLGSPQKRPRGGELWFWLVLGMPQVALPYALIFWAQQFLSSSMTAMLFGTAPVFTVVAAHFLLEGELITRAKLAGVILAVLAIGLLQSQSQTALVTSFTVWPAAAVLGAAVSAALAAVLVRRHGRSTPVQWLAALQICSSAVVLSILAAVLERGATVSWSGSAVMAVVYLAFVVTVGCYSGLFWLLKRLEATFVSLMVVVETAVAVLLGIWLLSEPTSPRLMLGLMLVMVSVVLVRPKRSGRERGI